MLANSQSLDFLKSIEYDSRYVVTEKFDGFRETLYLGPWSNLLISRGEKEHQENVPHIRDVVLPEFGGTILDCEGIAPTRLIRDTKSILGCKPEHAYEAQKRLGKLELVVFDILQYKRENIRGLPFLERRRLLHEVVGRLHEATPEIHLEVLRRGEKLRFYEEVVANGGEGVMIKDTQGLYIPGRGNAWLKVKKESTWDYQILGFTKGKGKYVDVIGAIVYGYYENGVPVVVGKTSGMTDEWRAIFAAHPEAFIGKTIEIGGQETLKGKAIRFPRFIQVREDK